MKGRTDGQTHHLDFFVWMGEWERVGEMGIHRAKRGKSRSLMNVLSPLLSLSIYI